MSLKNDITSLGATRFAVGLSQIVRCVATDYVTDWQLRILVGGGTLEIVPPAFSGTSTVAATAWGTGYAVGSSEVIFGQGPATVYLAATGATMTAQMALFYSNGVTLK
jgi:hypothetical protein